MLLHEESEHLRPTTLRHGVVLFLVGRNHRAERIQQFIERVLFVHADFVNQAVEQLHRPVVIPLIANTQNGADSCPVLFKVFCDGRHDFHAPRSYSRWVRTWRTYTLPRLKWIDAISRYLLPPMLNTIKSSTVSADGKVVRN